MQRLTEKAPSFLARDLPERPLCIGKPLSQFEVDFILGRKLAIEVKTTEHVNDRMLKGLRALKEEQLIEHYVVVSMDPTPRTIDGTEWRQNKRIT